MTDNEIAAQADENAERYDLTPEQRATWAATRAVPCPACLRAAGVACMSRRTGRDVRWHHPQRYRAMRAVEAYEAGRAWYEEAKRES